MIYSPVEVKVKSATSNRTHLIRGVLLDGQTMKRVLKVIERIAANGLKGTDAALLAQMAHAVAVLKK